MIYRNLGNTGLKVSEIGLGCEGFLGQTETFTSEMFDIALGTGVNCMDLYSPNPDMHRRIGSAIKSVRQEFVLQAHLCTVWQDNQYKATRKLVEVKPAFEAMLKNIGTSHVDIGMIHYIDSESVWEQINRDGIMDYAQQLKKQGKIRHIGMSSHNPKVALKAIESGLIEVLMFSVNPCYDLQPGDEDIERLWSAKSYEKPLLNMDADRQNLYETCDRLGVGITVMKAFAGGQLLTADSPAGVALTVNQCIHYALNRPAVATVFSGIHSKKELMASLAYETASAAEKDYTAVFSSFPKISWQGHCMYCGHCAPCPKGIEIAAVTKFLNLAKAQSDVPETVRQHYEALSAKASDCIECGACEKRCPFKVSIRENMRTAKKLFN